MSLTEQDVYRFGPAAKKQIMAKLSASKKSAAKPAKYHNVKTDCGGITFDSAKEAARYQFLLSLWATGFIEDLRLQHRITIVEGYTKPDGERVRPLVYVADFSYIRDGKRVYEDVKGHRTQEYINKRKLVYELRGITIEEV